jgi:hypothetical protein
MAIDDEMVERICTQMRKGLSQKQACAIVGADNQSLQSATIRTKAGAPQRPDWRQKLDAARAECVRTWIDILKKGGDEKNSAMVKSAESMLFAQDRRFRKEEKPEGKGIAVMLFVGRPGEEEVLIPVKTIVRELPEGGS